uniref:Uncharacterized protein n=1 Tax=Setaria viridis TaxID=4556 RepID=A0A4V6D255_SETVI|nr:TPD1 protein homolog 1-like [Setaria viridis]TKV97335.1 hypothetical protein SEVIR_9G487500v2 [Setaria viridis]
MGNAAAVVVVSLLLACDGSGDASSSSPVKQHQRQPASARVGETVFDPNCEDDVNLSQVDEGPQPGGEPGFRTLQVEIINTSIDRRTLHNVRVSCGGFSNDGACYLQIPDGFSRISDSECVVNGGGEFRPNEKRRVEFEYASKSEYPFAVTSVSC